MHTHTHHIHTHTHIYIYIYACWHYMWRSLVLLPGFVSTGLVDNIKLNNVIYSILVKCVYYMNRGTV